MNNKRINPRIVLQQTIIPDYRMGLFLLLREHWGECFEVYAGEADFGGSPVSTPAAWDHFKEVGNIYAFSDRLLWQHDSLWVLIGSDVAILNANMRIVSNWVILLLRRLLGRPTLLWGHAEGQSRVASKLRSCFLRLSSGFIAYTRSQAEGLSTNFPWLSLWVAANSCVPASDCIPACEGEEPDSFLYVGRLVTKKKVSLLLEGYLWARKEGLIATDKRLVFVGDGDERASLEQRVGDAGVQEVVHFAGHVSDVEQLRAYYGRAICSVSPGYVGLSATQSFSFGVPMLIARDEFHSPEIEACQEGFNACFFESDSPESLANMLAHAEQSQQAYSAKRSEISGWTRKNYSFEAMSRAFFTAVEEVANG